MIFNDSFFASCDFSLIGRMASNECLSCTTSLGLTFPVATFDMSRSISPIRLMFSCTSSSTIESFNR